MTSPNNTQTLNLALQSLKQSLEALDVIGKLEELPSLDLVPAQTKAVRQHAERIVDAEVSISQLLKLAMRESDIPVQRASSSLLKYYREHFLPHKELIWRLSDPVMAELWDALPQADTSEIYSSNASHAITMGMEQLEELLRCNPDALDYDQIEFDITEASRLIDSVYFQPDEWLCHIDELTAILCSRDASAIPGHVRARLKEVYRSFIFGNWLACIALSRALLEYVLLDRRSALSIDAFEDPANTQRVRRLSDLVDQASQTRPELREAMSHIQQYGNEVMHPKLRRNVDSYLPGKKQATDCLHKVRLVVASLYT